MGLHFATFSEWHVGGGESLDKAEDVLLRQVEFRDLRALANDAATLQQREPARRAGAEGLQHGPHRPASRQLLLENHLASRRQDPHGKELEISGVISPPAPALRCGLAQPGAHDATYPDASDYTVRPRRNTKGSY